MLNLPQTNKMIFKNKETGEAEAGKSKRLGDAEISAI